MLRRFTSKCLFMLVIKALNCFITKATKKNFLGGFKVRGRNKHVWGFCTCFLFKNTFLFGDRNVVKHFFLFKNAFMYLKFRACILSFLMLSQYKIQLRNGSRGGLLLGRGSIFLRVSSWLLGKALYHSVNHYVPSSLITLSLSTNLKNFIEASYWGVEIWKDVPLS